jgi:hypothetical protein
MDLSTTNGDLSELDPLVAAASLERSADDVSLIEGAQ